MRARRHAPASRQRAQSPSASITVRSIAKPVAAASSMSAPAGARQRRLGHPAAGAADQEAGVVRRLGMGAGGEGPQPLDPVREAVRHQEVERPVGHRRLAPEPGLGQLVEDLVGGHRPVRGEERLQHEGPRRRQPQPPLGAERRGRRQRPARGRRGGRAG